MWVALDTATDRASVALGTPGTVALLEENIQGARRHAAALLPSIEALLGRAGATLDDVRGVALSDGPGSFTGLRVGAALVKALARARRLPFWTAPSLMVRAAGVAEPNQLVVAIGNALRGEVYSAGYRFTPTEIVTELIPSVRRPGELMGSAIAPDRVVGEAAPAVLEQLADWAGMPVIGPPASLPRASHLLNLVGRLGGAHEVVAVGEWEPVYGRPAEAQVRWEKAHGRPLPDPVGGSR
jgi:tRNA threonylcarbamoyladenosine biosynthesis protein TsaB